MPTPLKTRFYSDRAADDGYDYDAFVSYHVSSKIDQAERAVLREMVEKTRHVMGELGYKRIYDLNQEGAGSEF